MKFKTGDIVKDIYSGQICIIVEPYRNNSFDWEIIPIRNINRYGHVWKDCRHEKHLEPYEWKDYPSTFKEKLNLLLRHCFLIIQRFINK